jgi:hypothetical protein
MTLMASPIPSHRRVEDIGRSRGLTFTPLQPAPTGDEVTILAADDLLVDFDEWRAMAALRVLAA